MGNGNKRNLNLELTSHLYFLVIRLITLDMPGKTAQSHGISRGTPRLIFDEGCDSKVVKCGVTIDFEDKGSGPSRLVFSCNLPPPLAPPLSIGYGANYLSAIGVPR